MPAKIFNYFQKHYLMLLFFIPFVYFSLFSNAWYHGDDFTALATLTGDWSAVLYRIFTAQTFQVGSDPHYRPLANFFCAISFQTNSTLGHLLSTTFHAINSLLVFLLVKKISKSTRYACFSWLFFAFYPPLTTAIFWISAIGDLLTTLFALITALIFIDNKPSIKSNILLFLCFALSVLSKEMSLTLPVVLTVYSYLNKRIRADLTKLVLLFFTAIGLFGLRILILGHFLMGSYDNSYFASLTNSLISFAKYFYSMIIYIPLSLSVENWLFFVAALPFVTFLLVLFLSLAKPDKLKFAIVSLLLFAVVYAPVSGTFSNWRIYYPGALLAVGLGIAMNLSNHQRWRKFLYLSCFISIITSGFIGRKFIEAGNFNRNLTAAVHLLPQKELTLAAIPVSYGSYSPLFSSYEYLEYALEHFYADKKNISYAVPQIAESLPEKIELMQVQSDTMIFNAEPNKYSYFIPDTGLMGKRNFSFKTDRLNRFGKPTRVKIVFTKKDRVYYFTKCIK